MIGIPLGRDENRKVRIRDAAKILGTSEGELLSTNIEDGVEYLDLNFDKFFKEISKIDKLMLLTRNDLVVYEKIINGRDIVLFGKKLSIKRC